MKSIEPFYSLSFRGKVFLVFGIVFLVILGSYLLAPNHEKIPLKTNSPLLKGGGAGGEPMASSSKGIEVGKRIQESRIVVPKSPNQSNRKSQLTPPKKTNKVLLGKSKGEKGAKETNEIEKTWEHLFMLHPEFKALQKIQKDLEKRNPNFKYLSRRVLNIFKQHGWRLSHFYIARMSEGEREALIRIVGEIDSKEASFKRMKEQFLRGKALEDLLRKKIEQGDYIIDSESPALYEKLRGKIYYFRQAQIAGHGEKTVIILVNLGDSSQFDPVLKLHRSLWQRSFSRLIGLLGKYAKKY